MMTHQTSFQTRLDEHVEVTQLTRQLDASFVTMCTAVVAALEADKKLFFFGNGGSAADAQHLATELVARFTKDRRALPAIALTTDTSALTAIANDWSVEQMFSRQIEALGREGDVAIGFSTSGNSGNVLRAMEAARANGMVTVGFTGRDGGAMAPLLDHELRVPADVTARIQEMHIMLGHLLCGEIEHQLFGFDA
jgi:D-sedoheptulose 7-phosphate isomerase